MGFPEGAGAAVGNALDDTITGLRVVLARMENIDFWPPWDAAQTIIDAVTTAVHIATSPPEPDPADIESAATGWGAIAASVDQASVDLDRSHLAMSVDIWEGTAGDAARTSIAKLGTRVDTVTAAAATVKRVLTTAADAMTSARERHASAYPVLTKHLTITWSDALPWDLVSKLRHIVGDVIQAVQTLVGSYEDASAALTTARRQVVAAIDTIDLPTHLPGGVSAITVVNGWTGDDSGPLRGSVLERAGARLDAMSPQDRAEVQGLLAAAGSDQARAWILAAVASGTGIVALGRFAGQLSKMSPEQLKNLDPTSWPTGSFVQPDETTCGSSSLVVSRMINDPAYAMYITQGFDPLTGQTSTLSTADRFQDASLAMHDQTNGVVDHGGNIQPPWPEALGTTPAGVAHQMAGQGGSGIPGSGYGTDLTDPSNPGADYDHIVAATQDGQTVPLYVGNADAPRHIVLVTASSNDSLTIYDPSAGQMIDVSRADFESGHLNVAGWSQPWLAVTPR
ncbi:MAG: hypothetical protein DLM59_00545 [Pseudonocardiales bacterium]|nr:MAG: hypothetical protein DLM59_00545 [Pseudonocardiales bacterium]